MPEGKGLLIVYTGPGKGENYLRAWNGVSRGGSRIARADGAVY